MVVLRACAAAVGLSLAQAAAGPSGAGTLADVEDAASRRTRERYCSTGEVAAGGPPQVGIVTMHTSDIMSYANSTEAINRRYAKRWGYGFHIVDHVIDRTRVPHWSKLHAVQMYLPEYDYLLWIDADAAFYDFSRSLEDVMDMNATSGIEMWAQDIWPDYPSIHRGEQIDTGIVLFRNSLWTRQFLTELYYFADCQQYLNWTEQYCFTVAYRADLLGMRDRLVILPTPLINHHILPPPENRSGMFIFHMAGRPKKSRAHHFLQLHDGRAEGFHADPQYAAFWNFHRLFARHSFGGIASLQTCLFGIGPTHRAFLDALLFHFPYMGSFTIVRQGAPGLWSQMKATEEVGERFPDRMAHIDIKEYMLGKTRDGENFVEGFFCDVFILGAESWRHLPSVEVLGRLARSGLEPDRGNDKNKGFGYSPLRDVYFVWLYDRCSGGVGAVEAAHSRSAPVAASGARLDNDDEDGSALVAACELLAEARGYTERMAAATPAGGRPRRAQAEAPAQTEATELGSEPILWSIKAPGERGAQALGDVALARFPRDVFVDTLTSSSAAT